MTSHTPVSPTYRGVASDSRDVNPDSGIRTSTAAVDGSFIAEKDMVIIPAICSAFVPELIMFDSNLLANSNTLPLVLLNYHPTKVRLPAPGTSAVLSQRPWTPAASARRRRLRAPGCG